MSGNVWKASLSGVTTVRGLNTLSPYRRVTRARYPNGDPELCTDCWAGGKTGWHKDLSCVGAARVVYKVDPLVSPLSLHFVCMGVHARSVAIFSFSMYPYACVLKTSVRVSHGSNWAQGAPHARHQHYHSVHTTQRLHHHSHLHMVSTLRLHPLPTACVVNRTCATVTTT